VAEIPKDGNGVPYLSSEYLKELCEEKGLYVQPHLNERLYLHFKAIKKIQGLQPYVNLKALWLENNMLSSIQGLDHLKNLTTLYLHHNSIDKIEGLSNLSNLVILNLSFNRIKTCDGLQELKKLKTLDLSNNMFTDINDCEQLVELTSLTNLDIRDNQIDNYKDVLPLFERLETITNLQLAGNPACRLISNYRRQFILHMANLSYFDEKPVFDQERQLAIAFSEGGKVAEYDLKKKFEEQAKVTQSLDKNQKIREF